MDQELVDKIRDYARQNGFRPAKKREVVALSLSQFEHGIDGDSLWSFLRNEHPSISRGTVYSSLKWLTESGIITRKVRDDRVYIFSLQPM
ncbi:Fur family transcriptional regulator [Spirosoma sp. HMF4905]|uniref:Fur family transcriptional regulator n=1 Tax=Spirosoma arboris TaxID=2682092 RepID=A0A7K1SJE8_9BACT|nr:transcriptional repressor [Spirosoma arboris]MVM33941.1 Fur family transcriptional regulator [Spirosoma arboris]